MQFMLKSKLVVTESGKTLGEVRDCEVMWPDMRVVKLDLRRSLFGGDLLVTVDAIVKIEGDRIIVRDALVTAGESKNKESRMKGEQLTQPAGVMTRE